MNAVYGRYSYQPKGATFFEHYLTGVLNTPEGHTENVAALNKGDKGKFLWKWQEINKDDFDYPERGIPPA